MQPDEPYKGYCKNWARLKQEIYKIDPLTCPKCQGPMAVIAFIEAEDVIEKILKHLGLWEPKPRPPPRLDTQRDFPYTPPHLKATSYHLTEKGNALMSDIRACWKDLYRGYCAIFGEQEANRVNDLIAKTNHTR